MTEVDRIDQRAARPPLSHQLGRLQVHEVKRQRRRRQPKLAGDESGREPILSGLHQQPMDLEPGVVGEGIERTNGAGVGDTDRSHATINPELSND
jgi:hypothetical protein